MFIHINNKFWYKCLGMLYRSKSTGLSQHNQESSSFNVRELKGTSVVYKKYISVSFTSDVGRDYTRMANHETSLGNDCRHVSLVLLNVDWNRLKTIGGHFSKRQQQKSLDFDKQLSFNNNKGFFLSQTDLFVLELLIFLEYYDHENSREEWEQRTGRRNKRTRWFYDETIWGINLVNKSSLSLATLSLFLLFALPCHEESKSAVETWEWFGSFPLLLIWKRMTWVLFLPEQSLAFSCLKILDRLLDRQVIVLSILLSLSISSSSYPHFLLLCFISSALILSIPGNEFVPTL